MGVERIPDDPKGREGPAFPGGSFSRDKANPARVLLGIHRSEKHLCGPGGHPAAGAAGATSAEAEGRAWVHILKLLPARRSRSRGWL